MSFRALTCSLAAVLLTVVLEVPAAAQTLYGSLTGNVTDSSGSVVPNAKVEVLNVGTSILKSAQTDERGAYLFTDLQPGVYRVTISAPSFSTRAVEGVTITQNTTLRVDATLAVSQLIETVTVNAAAVALQTDRADINHVISANEAVDLPLMN